MRTTAAIIVMLLCGSSDAGPPPWSVEQHDHDSGDTLTWLQPRGWRWNLDTINVIVTREPKQRGTLTYSVIASTRGPLADRLRGWFPGATPKQFGAWWCAESTSPTRAVAHCLRKGPKAKPTYSAKLIATPEIYQLVGGMAALARAAPRLAGIPHPPRHDLDK